MKILFLASVAVVGLFGAAALASDLPTKAPVNKTQITAPPYNWSGFYVGANFGGAWTNGSLSIPGNNFYGGITELIGGYFEDLDTWRRQPMQAEWRRPANTRAVANA